MLILGLDLEDKAWHCCPPLVDGALNGIFNVTSVSPAHGVLVIVRGHPKFANSRYFHLGRRAMRRCSLARPEQKSFSRGKGTTPVGSTTVILRF